MFSLFVLNALTEKVKAFFSKLHQNFSNDIRLSQSACDYQRDD